MSNKIVGIIKFSSPHSKLIMKDDTVNEKQLIISLNKRFLYQRDFFVKFDDILFER